MEKLIRSHHKLWLGYKERLVKVSELLKEPGIRKEVSLREGDSFIRFGSASYNTTLNSLFFVYEIGNIFPRVKWRYLIPQGLQYLLLKKPIYCIPAFSFSMDQLATLLYWGESVPYLIPETLKELNLREFILKVNDPSSVEVSAANLVWPKAAYPKEDHELITWSAYYIFNSLMPPILGEGNEVWRESPFVLIGEKTIEFLTIHKTLSIVDKKTARFIAERRIANVRAKVIDRDFNVKQILVDIPENCIDELDATIPPQPVVFVKRVTLRSDPSLQEPKLSLRYTIFPFGSLRLFAEEGYGKLLTILSIVLRKHYLESNDPFFFTLSPGQFMKYLERIFGQFTRHHLNEELGLRLAQTQDGLLRLGSLLVVYAPSGTSFSYLHPALFECFPSNVREEPKKDDLIRFQMIAYEFGQKAESSHMMSSVFLLQKRFLEKFGVNLSYRTARQLTAPLRSLLKVCIPLSKRLAFCPEMGDYA